MIICMEPIIVKLNRSRHPVLGRLAFIGGVLLLGANLLYAVPLQINYQGRVTVDGTGFNGTGQFKFALLGEDSTVYWGNSALSQGEPENPVSVEVVQGVFSLLLGDTGLANMNALSASVFDNETLLLRVWFSDGSGFEKVGQDRPITSVAFAIRAESAKVAETVSSLPPGFVTEANLASELQAKLTDLQEQINQSVVASPTDILAGHTRVFTIEADAWSDSPGAGPLSARYGHGSVWTGTGMATWGGVIASSSLIATGSIYNPATDIWTPITPLDAPGRRSDLSGVWTGTEFVVWSGYGSGGPLNTGGRYHTASQSWLGLSSSGAPSARYANVAVWTGSRMLIWGGRNNSGILNDGATYDPSADSWVTFDLSGTPAARHGATAVVAGSEIIIWGGEGAAGALGDGARLALSGGSPSAWTAINATDAPGARSGHTAVWTGAKLIVWGGSQGGTPMADGAVYDPATDSWIGLATDNAPSAREKHAAVWTGSEMVVIGGEGVSGALEDSHAYNPTTDTWRPLNGSVGARSGSTAVWTGSRILVFGGESNGQVIGQPMEIDPTPPMYLYRKQ